MKIDKTLNMGNFQEKELSEKLITVLNQSQMGHEEMLAIVMTLVLSLMESTEGGKIEMRMSKGKRLTVEPAEIGH